MNNKLVTIDMTLTHAYLEYQLVYDALLVSDI